MPRDPLQDLLHRAMSLARKKQKLAIVEEEAKARVEKKRKVEELSSTFDAERFRFLITTLPQFSGMDLTSIRKQIDDQIERSFIRDFNSQRKAKAG